MTRRVGPPRIEAPDSEEWRDDALCRKQRELFWRVIDEDAGRLAQVRAEARSFRGIPPDAAAVMPRFGR